MIFKYQNKEYTVRVKMTVYFHIKQVENNHQIMYNTDMLNCVSKIMEDKRGKTFNCI